MYFGYAMDELTFAKRHSMSDANKKKITNYLANGLYFDRLTPLPKGCAGFKVRSLAMIEFKNYIKPYIEDIDDYKANKVTRNNLKDIMADMTLGQGLQ